MRSAEMDIATGAINILLPKLVELLVGEYKLHKGVKGEIKQLEEELTSMAAALRKVSEVPPDELDEQVKIWARDVRELSYDIEDQVDTFMLKGKEHQHTEPVSLKGLLGKLTHLYKKAKTNHKIHNVVKDIMDQAKKVAERRDRYKVDNIAARTAMVPVDPRLEGMYRKATELVGIGQPKNELAKRLLEQENSSPQRKQSNIISIVGFGGLGKTTVANSLLQDLKAKFDCHVFVSVSLNPDMKKIFKNILLQLDEKEYCHIDEGWELNQLIDKTIEFLKHKKFLCVIDDLWKESAWDAIKLAFQDGHPRSKIIVTTRKRTVADHVGGGVYELKPLSHDDSRKLLNKRVFDIDDDGCPPSLGEVTGKILKKCGGVPLAIITTASLLASKPMCSEEWEKVNKSIGSGLGSSLDVDKMRKILSLSYNDLPFHLKTCLLSLSKYPEDQVIRKDVLILNWIAEGFITEETQQLARTSLREIGENYFSDLINRSLIQPVPMTRLVDSHYTDKTEIGVEVPACQVHDMVLELINQLSAEEGFGTTIQLEDGQQAITLTSAMQKRKIRRLTLHNNSIKSYAGSPGASKEHLCKVRSLDIFGKVASVPPLSSFRVLRVLQVDDCSRLDNNHLNDLGKLRLLRFLRLHGLNVGELPECIGELDSLETLDIRGAYYWPRSKLLLPVSFGKLRRLVRLLADVVELPYGLTLENMRSLEEVVGILVTVHAMNEISELSEVKVLTLVLGEPLVRGGELVGSSAVSSNQLLIHKCLQRFRNLKDFVLTVTQVTYCDLDLMAEVPSSLQRFVSNQWYLSFPRWINPSLSCLSVMSIILCGVCVLPEHLEKLAELPSLRFLRLCADSFSSKQERLVVPSGASAFPCLTELQFECEIMFLQFQRGAVRKLQRLSLKFNAYVTNDWFPTNNFDYGLENLPSLRHVVVQMAKNKECPEAQDDFRKAINDHPNHPLLDIS